MLHQQQSTPSTKSCSGWHTWSKVQPNQEIIKQTSITLINKPTGPRLMFSLKSQQHRVLPSNKEINYHRQQRTKLIESEIVHNFFFFT